MAKALPEVEKELESRVEACGFELVQAEWAGSRQRPILRIRIDVGSESGEPGEGGVTVDDCAKVSRGLEAWLDGLDSVPPRYVLEVSSPGLERPLTRSKDWGRFVGRHIALKGAAPLAGRAPYLEGELLGLSESKGGESVRVRLEGGDEVEIGRDEIDQARLIFRWGDRKER